MTQDVLKTIAQEITACTLCGLHRHRTQSVPGAGNPNADLMLVGEAPGYYEDQQGLPFIGAAGRYLDELLKMISLERDTIFMLNIVRCRPPRNRDPLRAEIQACRPYLERQIAAVQPKIVATLGKFSLAAFLPDAHIQTAHGQPRYVDGRVIFPLHRPANALRNPALKAEMEADFKRIPEIMENYSDYVEAPPPPEDEPPPEPPKQLSLFDL